MGRCMWKGERKPGPKPTPFYSTCTPDSETCPDEVCDSLERLHYLICPQDCTGKIIYSFSLHEMKYSIVIVPADKPQFPTSLNRKTGLGIDRAAGICTCNIMGTCVCNMPQRKEGRKNTGKKNKNPETLVTTIPSTTVANNHTFFQPNLSRHTGKEKNPNT